MAQIDQLESVIANMEDDSMSQQQVLSSSVFAAFVLSDLCRATAILRSDVS